MKVYVNTKTKIWSIELTYHTFKSYTYKHITISDNVNNWKKKQFTVSRYEESINNLNIPKLVKKKAIELINKKEGIK